MKFFIWHEWNVLWLLGTKSIFTVKRSYKEIVFWCYELPQSLPLFCRSQELWWCPKYQRTNALSMSSNSTSSELIPICFIVYLLRCKNCHGIFLPWKELKRISFLSLFHALNETFCQRLHLASYKLQFLVWFFLLFFCFFPQELI